MARPPIGSRTEVDRTKPIAAPSPEVRDQRLDQAQRAEQHALDAGPPVVLGGLQHRAGRRAADRDQRAVDPAQALPGLGDEPLGGVGIGEVGRRAERGRRTAELLGGRATPRRRTGS